MIGLDTNVLLRYIMEDDAKQSVKASRLIESLTIDAPGFVSIVALGGAPSSAYGLTREQLGQAVEALLRTKEIVIDRADQVLRALRVFSATPAAFAACLIERSAAAAGCDRMVTFDIGAAKVAGMTLIQ